MMANVNAVAIFCEDMRDEVSGQISIVGIIPDFVEVPAVPGAFGRLCVYVRIYGDLRGVKTLSAKLSLFGEHEIVFAEVPAHVIQSTTESADERGAPVFGYILRGQFSTFAVPKVGQVLAVATIDGVDRICGFIDFRVGDFDGEELSSSGTREPE